MSNISPASQRIQVLQVLGNAIVGGMETYATRLIERLPPDQFGVTVLCPYESPLADRLRASGVEVFITPMPDNPTWSTIQMTSALIQARSIDVLHAHLPNAHLLAGLAGKLMNKPVLTTIHGRQLVTLDLEVHHTAATHVSVVCRQTYFHALGLGVHAPRLHFIPNGVDPQHFKPDRPRPGVLRAKLGLDADVPLVGQVGRLSHEKGPDVFLRAALTVKQMAPHARFVLIGDGPMRGELQQLIERFQLEDSVHLVGVVEDMGEVYGDLDIAVSTSRSEAMPLAVMEAMASGLPVVGTRVGGVPDLIQHGHTGWVAGDGDFDAIAQHIFQLIDKPADRLTMGRRGRERIASHFSLDQSVQATMQLLKRLAQRPIEAHAVASPLHAGGHEHAAMGLNGVNGVSGPHGLNGHHAQL